MLGLILAANVSQAICAAVELGVPEALADGPRSVDDLAADCRADASQLRRLLTALAGADVFTRTADDTFGLTDLGATLVGTEEDGRSLAGLAAFSGSLWLNTARSSLTESVRSGSNAFRTAHGADLYEAIQEHGDLAALYERWAGYSAGVDLLAEPILDAYDFSTATHVVDAGGRYGTLLAMILEAMPGLSGTLFDLPDVEDDARKQLRVYIEQGRCRVITGSFFEGVPKGGDLYVLSNVLPDWDDERAVAILRECATAMPRAGRLLAIQPVFSEAALRSSGVSGFDLWMMIHSGTMRTLDEVTALLHAAGLDLLRVIRTASGAATIIEATPA